MDCYIDIATKSVPQLFAVLAQHVSVVYRITYVCSYIRMHILKCNNYKLIVDKNSVD